MLRFREFELSGDGGTLWRAGAAVAIRPKPLALLAHLLRNRERVVSTGELLAAVWPDVSVSHHALWSALRDLRRAIGDTDTAERTVRTLRGSGFQFVAEVADASAPEPVPAPTRVAPAAAELPASERGVAGALVDRDAAMAALLGDLAASARSTLRVSLIAGGAGMGKTRLTLELASEARRRGFEVRIGRCLDREGGTPFWPWLQVLRGVSVSAGTCAGPVAFDAVAACLHRLSEARPLLIVLDDLHWADEGSLRLLERLVTALDRSRIALVCAFRDPPRATRALARLLALAARHGTSTRVDLQGLRREAVSALLAGAAARVPAPGLIDAVLSATHGNPLFVTELAKLAAQGQLDVADPSLALPVPQRVRDVLRWQFERTSVDCQRVLRLLSLIGRTGRAGREVELAVLAHAAETSHAVALELLAEAEAAGFALIGGRHGSCFGFAHGLVRESIYRDLPLSERARLHHRMADALAAGLGAGAGVDASQLAYHYALGIADGGAKQALRWSRLAAAQAHARGACDDAVAHYDQALSALPLLARDPRLACELLLRQAEAAWSTDEDATAVQARFVVAAEAARAAGEPELFARAASSRSAEGAGREPEQAEACDRG